MVFVVGWSDYIIKQANSCGCAIIDILGLKTSKIKLFEKDSIRELKFTNNVYLARIYLQKQFNLKKIGRPKFIGNCDLRNLK